MGALSDFINENEKKKKPSQIASLQQKQKENESGSSLKSFLREKNIEPIPVRKTVVTPKKKVEAKPVVQPKPQKKPGLLEGAKQFIQGVVEILPSAKERSIAQLKDTGAILLKKFGEQAKKEYEKTPEFNKKYIEAVAKKEKVSPELAKQKVEQKFQGYSKEADKLRRSAEQNLIKAEAHEKSLAPIENPKNFAEFVKNPRAIGRTLGLSTPQFVTSAGIGLGATALTKNPALGLTLGFGSSFAFETGVAYRDAKAYGVEDQKADKIALLVGAAIAPLDILPIGVLLKSPAGAPIKRSIIKETVKGVVRQASLESSTESLQQIIGNAVARVYDANRNFFAGVPESALIGGILGGGLGTVEIPKTAINNLSQSDEAKAVEKGEKVFLPAEPINEEPLPEGLPPIIEEEFRREEIKPPEKFRTETEEKAYTQIKESGTSKFVDEYIGKNKNELNPDVIREMFTDYKGYNVVDFNRPVGQLKDKVYDQMLEDNAGQGNNTVLFTAGGSGSGKTVAVAGLSSEEKAGYSIILDSTFSYQSVPEDVKKALDNGYKVEIVYTLREPTASWTQGVLPRTKTEGRIVSEAYFLKTHQAAKDQVLAEYEKYKDNPNVLFDFRDNREGGNLDSVPVETVRTFSYNENEVAQTIALATEKAYEQKQLTKEQYEAIKADRPGRGDVGAKPPETPRKQKVEVKPVSKKPSFGTKAARQVQEVFADKFTKLGAIAENQADLIAKANPLIDEFISKAGKDKEILKGLRTALNKEMFGYVGTSGNYKADYGTLKTLMDSPDIGDYLSILEKRINEIDNILITAEPAPSEAFFLKREPSTAGIVDRLEPAKTPEELIEKINQLNKFAQSNAILRRTGGITREKAVGQFVIPGPFKTKKGVAKEGQVRLKGEYIASDSDYITVLAHELGHSIEFQITNGLGKDTFKVFGDNLNPETITTLEKELKAITLELEGEAAITENSQYYNKPSELLAHLFEKMIVSPGNLSEIAPTATELIEKQAITHPIIAEFIEAAQNNIDKGAPKFAFLADLRQTYQKHLGKRVGNIAYDEEVTHRAMQERAKIVTERFIKEKFKGVKDDPTLLFRVAEAIRISRDGQPEFGTRDFVLAKTETQVKELQETGWEEVDTQVEDDIAYPLFARQRYTKEEGQILYDKLSAAGKRLINDFTAERTEAKDYFNREIIKDINKVEGNIEGWVHHYFEDQPQSTTGKKLRFREKKAGTRMKRGGKEGYVEDFKKAMTKVMVDLESEKVFNDFITRQFARVTKPIPDGKNADNGWIEVLGNLKKGIGLKHEKQVVIIKDGKRFMAKQARYQMPKQIYERYKLWQGLTDEASRVGAVIADINRYWRINVLTHAGTAGTNFIGGGIQYSTKILSDFYTETLTGKIAYTQTKKNLSAMLKVLLPKGWNDAPDWVYGADQSNWYGQFTQQPTTSKTIAGYGNRALKLFGTYERYWKKVVSLSENARELKTLENMTQEGLRLPTKEERQLIADINRQVDLYAYDYDNVPVWLEIHQKSVLGQAIKPFAKYPYKYAKHFTNMAGAVFDRTIPWQERMAKLLALTTIIAIFAYYAEERKKKQQTPEGTEETPARLSTRGRIFAGWRGLLWLK